MKKASRIIAAFLTGTLQAPSRAAGVDETWIFADIPAVLTSTLREVEYHKAPSNIYVVKGDDIRRWGARRLTEIIDRFIPGAIITEDGDSIAIAFRGIAADNNLKVLLLFNGHNYNSQWNDGGQSEIELGMLEDIDRIEIVVGPGSALYGGGATLAVINMITRTGEDFEGVEVKANYGSGDYKQAELVSGGRKQGGYDYLLSMGLLEAKGYDNNDNGSLSIARYPLSWRFFANVNRENERYQARFTRSSRVFYNSQFNPGLANLWSNYDTFFVSAQRALPLSDHSKVQLEASFDSASTQRHDLGTGLKWRGIGEQRYGVKANYFLDWRSLAVVSGLEYRRDEVNQDWEGDNYNMPSNLVINSATLGQRFSDTYSRRVVTPYGRDTLGLFLQGDYSFSPSLSLLGGVRYDYVEAPAVSAGEEWGVTPRVALVFSPAEATVYKAMYSSGFRMPQMVLTGPDLFQFGSQAIDTQRKAEKMDSFEATVFRGVSAGNGAGVNLFWNRYRDMTGFVNGVFTAGSGDFYGGEFLVNARWRSLVWRGVHQVVRAGPSGTVFDPTGIHFTRDEKHILLYPEDVTKGFVELFLTPQLAVNANVNYAWKTYGNRGTINERIGGYVIMNANVSWSFGGSSLVLSGYNLANREVLVPVTSSFTSGTAKFVPIARMNWNLVLRHKF